MTHRPGEARVASGDAFGFYQGELFSLPRKVSGSKCGEARSCPDAGRQIKKGDPKAAPKLLRARYGRATLSK